MAAFYQRVLEQLNIRSQKEEEEQEEDEGEEGGEEEERRLGGSSVKRHLRLRSWARVL